MKLHLMLSSIEADLSGSVPLRFDLTTPVGPPVPPYLSVPILSLYGERDYFSSPRGSKHFIVFDLPSSGILLTVIILIVVPSFP